MLPIISKLYCRGGETEFVVRMRPHAVYGGGLVVTDCSSHKVVFRVDGCGVLGKRDELILRDADSVPLLLMRRKGAGFVEALCFNKVWKGYRLDQLEASGSVVKKQLVFSLKESSSSSSSSCFISKGGGPIRITTQPRSFSNKSWDFEIKGYFPDKCCSILDCQGNVVGITKELETFKDVYHVVVNPGIDQAFVFGVIAILDYIYGESTICPS
ncbi:protein LURP-one-related 6 [Arachis duranensis]|uniref:Protein LURP-one-related 6 n=1 Tax=Arachis duranensis TaxID=130453 RepID=A0A6P4B3R4_ARADU|nr:protein LURP-one-related 6 [Arachis duranensis]